MSRLSTATQTPAALGYRPLREPEIVILQQQGCTAESWHRVTVAETFVPHALRNVALYGNVRLGACSETVKLPGGWQRPSGIENAVLCNCAVGHNVYIHNVGRHIANYDIGDDVVIDHVGLLAVDLDLMPPQTAYGVGVLVEALNESGGRAVMLFDRLSSQWAYIQAAYRHRDDVRAAVEAQLRAAIPRLRTSRGQIGRGTIIAQCGTLLNVRIGEAAVIQGAVRLANGTVHSSPDAPTRVGEGVSAEHFILAAGSSVEDGALLKHVFVGQGARVGAQFSAQHSLVFANCELFHGEACSVVAGPYTVSHHKSSLLIAGMYSFFNAGSGNNHSNHMYKLGPVHAGIVERGNKSSSSCYLLWPSRTGAFTVVVGRHAGRLDTSCFPFSYLLESGGKSILIPGANFYTSGTRRDILKWPARDRRTGDDKLDLIHYAALNPSTMGKLLQGRRILAELSAKVHPEQEHVAYGGAFIPCVRLHKGISVYDMAVQLYLGGTLASRLRSILEAGTARTESQLLQLLLAAGHRGQGTWVDLCGLLAPQAEVQQFMDDVAAGKLDLTAAERIQRQWWQQYQTWEWDWVLATWLGEIGLAADEVRLADVARAIEQWRAVTLQCNNWILRDAEQEFSAQVQIGYGIDDPAAREVDFAAVRGTFHEHAFVRTLQEENRRVARQAEELLRELDALGTDETGAN